MNILDQVLQEKCDIHMYIHIYKFKQISVQTEPVPRRPIVDEEKFLYYYLIAVIFFFLVWNSGQIYKTNQQEL